MVNAIFFRSFDGNSLSLWYKKKALEDAPKTFGEF